MDDGMAWGRARALNECRRLANEARRAAEPSRARSIPLCSYPNRSNKASIATFANSRIFATRSPSPVSSVIAFVPSGPAIAMQVCPALSP
jgi:hypothetical protein